MSAGIVTFAAVFAGCFLAHALRRLAAALGEEFLFRDHGRLDLWFSRRFLARAYRYREKQNAERGRHAHQ